MSESKRLSFLKCFLKLYGVERIELISETDESIKGLAIYDENDPNEHQEFIWNKTEEEVPSPELNIVIDRIVKEKWHQGDKISTHIDLLEFEEFDSNTKTEILEELFNVEIRMIDDGKETDYYYVHQ